MRPSCHKYYYRPPTRTEAERTEYLKQFIVNCVSDLVRPGVCQNDSAYYVILAQNTLVPQAIAYYF